MARWFQIFMKAHKAPIVEDDALRETIAHIHQCRGYLLMLIEECRLAREIAGATADELENYRQRLITERAQIKPQGLTRDEKLSGVTIGSG